MKTVNGAMCNCRGEVPPPSLHHPALSTLLRPTPPKSNSYPPSASPKAFPPSLPTSPPSLPFSLPPLPYHNLTLLLTGAVIRDNGLSEGVDAGHTPRAPFALALFAAPFLWRHAGIAPLPVVLEGENALFAAHCELRRGDACWRGYRGYVGGEGGTWVSHKKNNNVFDLLWSYFYVFQKT